MAPLSLNKEKTGNSPISYIYRKDGINRKYQLLTKTNIHIMINLKIYIIVDHTPPLSFCYDTVLSPTVAVVGKKFQGYYSSIEFTFCVLSEVLGWSSWGWVRGWS